MKNILFPILILWAAQLSAQQELMMYQLHNVWHQNTLNPASFPKDKRIAIGFGAYTVDAAHSGKVTLSDLSQKSGNKTVINFGDLLPLLEDQNTVDFGLNIQTLSFGIRLPGTGWALQVGHAARFAGQMQYPKSLFDLLWKGNGAFIGQTVDIAPTFNSFGWSELGLGVSKKFLNVTVGGRIKYLSGNVAIISDKDHKLATAYTDPDIYQLTLKSDYAFYSTGIINRLDTAGLGYFTKLNKLNLGPLFSKNTGLAFDLGITANLTEKLQVSASVLDIGGAIKWKDDAKYYHSEGTFEYEGVTLPGSTLTGGSDSLDFNNEFNDLNDKFQFKQTDTEFETKLPMRMYLGATFKLTEKIAFGASFFRQQGGDLDEITAAGANVQYSPKKWLSVGAMIAGNDRSSANMGLSLIIKPGPVQLYLASDNIISAVQYKGSPKVNFRAGASLVL